MTDHGLTHIGSLKHLQSLNLSGCYNLTNKGLAHIISLKQLQSLDLSGCYKITEQGLARFPKRITISYPCWGYKITHATFKN
jgi:F-box/leucine-rich repeat protein 14